MLVRAFKCDECGTYMDWPKGVNQTATAERAAEKAGWAVGSPGDFDLCGPCRFAPPKPMPDAPAKTETKP